MSPVRASAAGLACLLGLALAACDAGEPGDPAASRSGLANRIAELPGVTDVAVDSVTVDQDQAENLVRVDTAPDVTADQIAAVLAAVAADPPEDTDPGNFRYTGVVYLDAGTTEWSSTDDDHSGLWFGVRALDRGDGDLARAAELLAAARAVPEARVSQQVTADVRDLTVDVGSADEVAPAARALATDPGPAGAGSVTVVAGEGGRDGSLRSGRGPIDPGLVAVWESLLDPGDPVSGTGVSRLVVARDRSGRVSASTEVTVPGRVPVDRVTPAAYGDVLWPTIRGQLDVLAGLPRGSELVVTYVPRPGYVEERTLLQVFVGRPPPGSYRTGGPFDAGARAYLEMRS